jgi:hypothetical protein
MKRKVSIEEAHVLQHEGEWVDNPKYDPLDKSSNAEPKQIFKARYIVHLRPEPSLPEPLQYAWVEEAS